MNRSTSRVLLALLATLCWPSGAFATAFDIQLLEFQIIGENAFFDDFEDGQRDSPPTSFLFTESGVTTESAGALQFTDADGFAQSGNVLFDRVLASPAFFTDGGGGSVLTARWASDLGSNGLVTFAIWDPGFSDRTLAFRIGTTDPGDLIGGVSSPCAGLQASVQPGNFGTALSGCDAIDPAGVTGDIVLQLVLDDERNEARVLYSVDGGMTFVAQSGFDVVPGSVSIFAGPEVVIMAAGAIIPEPSTAALLICAILAMARRRAAHKSSR